MSITTDMNSLGEPLASRLGLELVDVEYKKEGGQNVLRFLIDKEDGVTLDDCEALSRLLDEELDRLDPIEQSYVLQVSSPGIERPLKKPEDYIRFIGRPARIKLFVPLNGQKIYQGILRGAEGKNILLENDEHALISLPYEQIAKANLAFYE